MNTALLVLAFGCQGDDEGTTTTPTVPDDTSLPGTDSGLEGTFVDAAYFAVTAFFAFDEPNSMSVQFAEPGTGLRPLEIVITLIDTSASSSGIISAENSCSVYLTAATSRPQASWVEPNLAWAGFDLPSTTEVRNGCVNYGLPGEFQGDAGMHVAKWSWGAGVAPLDDYVEETLMGSLPPSEWAALEPFVVGGALQSDLFAGGTTASSGYTALGFAIGYEVDGNFEIETGGTGNAIPINSDFVNMPGGIATGYYEVTMGPWSPGSALAAEPP